MASNRVRGGCQRSHSNVFIASLTRVFATDELQVASLRYAPWDYGTFYLGGDRINGCVLSAASSLGGHGRVRCVSRCDKEFQFTRMLAWVAHGASRIDLRLRGRDSFLGFFNFASPAVHFLLRGLAVADVSESGAGIVDNAIQSTAQKRQSTKGGGLPRGFDTTSLIGARK